MVAKLPTQQGPFKNHCSTPSREFLQGFLPSVSLSLLSFSARSNVWHWTYNTDFLSHFALSHNLEHPTHGKNITKCF